MISEVWLKIAAKKRYTAWVPGTVQAFKTKPTVNDKEIAVKITIEIPDEVFEEPVYEAKVILPKITRQLPEKIEIANAVQKELSKHLGFKVKLEMNEPEEEEL